MPSIRLFFFVLLRCPCREDRRMSEPNTTHARPTPRPVSLEQVAPASPAGSQRGKMYEK
ncbi:hypothetical protein B0T18DRAFT_416577 [Schizothecium vesticola]|uniref:Uncharacterized protein n=1 Tax=Schizothecium vesticola TaxID=314040 RepID=A0AA40ERK0_9PEZI|nr:hypothetical protein B0T18DRAFT_416577 [Schizothecium vesticola]